MMCGPEWYYHRDIITCRYYHFTHVYHKWQSYDGVQQTKFFVIVDYFLPFNPSNNPKNQNFENMKKENNNNNNNNKKCPGDTILTKCTKNYDHVLYYFWNMVHDKCNFYFSFWAIFCLFNCLKTQKIKILKIWKKARKILKPNYTKMYDHIMCSSWDKVCNGYQDGWTDERMEQGTYRVGCPT